MDIINYIESGVLERYALGQCSPQEERAVNCLSVIYPEVQQEIDLIGKTMYAVAQARAVSPAAATKLRLMAEVSKTQQISVTKTEKAPVLLAAAAPQAKVVAMQNATNKWLVAACGVLAAVLLGVFGSYKSQNAELKQQLADVQNQTQLAQVTSQKLGSQVKSLKLTLNDATLSGYTIIKMAGLPAKKAYNSSILWNKSTKLVKIYANNLPPTSPEHQYQLWAIVDGKPVSLGVFEASDSELQTMINIENPQAFAVTLEPRGGSATPNMQQMYVLGNV